METNLTEIMDELIEVLRANMTDPIQSRSDEGKNWIVSELPAYSLDTPYVKLSFVSSNLDPLSIGSGGYKQTALIQVTIVTKVGEDREVGGNKLNHKELAEYFASQIIEATKTVSNFNKPWRLRVEGENHIPAKGCFYYLTLDIYALFQR